MSKSILGIALVLIGVVMLLFFAINVIRTLWSDPEEAMGMTMDHTMPMAVASSVGEEGATAPNQSPSQALSSQRLALESYCLWPNDTLFDIAQYAGVSLDSLTALNQDNPLHAGSTIYLPPGSTPPAQWTQPRPAITSMKELPFGVSGIYLGPDNRQKRIALTFDVGYVPENKGMMEMLAQRGIRATFFVVGFSVMRKPEIITDILSNGHELANHSWSHENLRGMNEESLRYELNRTESTVQAAAPGASTKPFFRAPFGALDENIIRISQEEGYQLIGWTVDSSDWVEGMTADGIYNRVTRHVCPGAIIVMHDMSPIVADALPRVLDFLTHNGYTFVLLSELLPPL
ncbi:MAG: polysaccharide deacetylase family protein [Caldilineaceae bacterium]|nr:polysaccharide deacetylase family protein [Caldilineaceae bacterium]